MHIAARVLTGKRRPEHAPKKRDRPGGSDGLLSSNATRVFDIATHFGTRQAVTLPVSNGNTSPHNGATLRQLMVRACSLQASGAVQRRAGAGLPRTRMVRTSGHPAALLRLAPLTMTTCLSAPHENAGVRYHHAHRPRHARALTLAVRAPVALRQRDRATSVDAASARSTDNGQNSRHLRKEVTLPTPEAEGMMTPCGAGRDFEDKSKSQGPGRIVSGWPRAWEEGALQPPATMITNSPPRRPSSTRQTATRAGSKGRKATIAGPWSASNAHAGSAAPDRALNRPRRGSFQARPGCGPGAIWCHPPPTPCQERARMSPTCPW
jgi:hypothetical protein